jgi:CheY-like chemotaxis protein
MPRLALVVDDSMLIRHTVCRFLEERNYTVESATNGLDALTLLDRLKPDLIVTDLQMPKMNGGELISAIKTRPLLAAVPVVVLTSHRTADASVEPRANFVIRKDIGIVEQLQAALSALGQD